ncbi:MAG: hypothetical protein EOO24_45810, partial [Comamonadaceae bacterium]
MTTAPKTGTLLLIERLADGSLRRIPFEAAQQLVAKPGARYALIDAATGAAPRGVQLLRKGNALVVEVQGDEHRVEIDDFYQQPDAAFLPQGELAGDELSGTQVTATTPVLKAGENGESVIWSASASGAPVASDGTLLAGGLGVVGLLAAAGSGGGGGDDAPAPVANRVIGTVVAGPATEGNGLSVIVYAADGTTRLGEGKVAADGTFSIDVGDYVGVVIARVVDASAGADYLDEATNAPKDLNAELFSMEVVREPNSTVVVNINVLTTLAYYKAVEAADGLVVG